MEVYTKTGWKEVETIDQATCHNCGAQAERTIFAGRDNFWGEILWAVCSNCCDETTCELNGE